MFHLQEENSRNFCGANPNLHPSSQTPVGMGAMGMGGSLGDSTVTSTMGGLLNENSNSNNTSMTSLANEEGSLSILTDLSADEGGGLTIISAADVNGVLLSEDDYPNNNDFTTLEGDDYNCSIEQFFPNVNNVSFSLFFLVFF